LHVGLGFLLQSLLPRLERLHSSHIRRFYNLARLQGNKVNLHSHSLTWAEA